MEGMSEREYSAHSGLSRGAIQKAKQTARMVLYRDGSIDAAASEARRTGMTDPDQQRRSVGGDSNLTFAYARAVGDAVTSTLTPGATPPGTIGRLILASHAGNAVANPNPALVVNRLRIAGTDFDAPGQAPAGATLEALTSDWVTNPATGQPWTWADLASLEIGFAGSN